MYAASSDYSMRSYWQQVPWNTWQNGNGHCHGKHAQQAGTDKLASKLFNDLDVDGNKSLSLEETGLDENTFAGMDGDQDGAVSLAELGTALEKQRAAERAQKAQAVLASIMGIGTGTTVTDTVADDEDGLVAGTEDGETEDPISTEDGETEGLASTEEGNTEELAATAAAAEAVSDDEEEGSLMAAQAAALEGDEATEKLVEAAAETEEDGTSGLTDRQLLALLRGNANRLANTLLKDLDTDASGNLSEEETGLDKGTFDAMDTNQDGVVSAEELAAALKEQRATLKASMAEETATDQVRGHRGRGRGMYARAFHGYGMQMGHFGHHHSGHQHGFSRAV